MTRPNPWQAGHAPSGELKAKSGGVGSRNSRPQFGQWRPRRNVRTRRLDPGLERCRRARTPSPPRTRSRARRRRRRRSGRPRGASRPSPSRSGATSSPISTVSPSGETARKKPARRYSAIRAASLGPRLRRPPDGGGRRPSRGSGPPASRAPGPRRRRAPRPPGPRPPGTAAAPQSGQDVVAAVREEQPQSVVDLGLRPHRRPGVADAVLLLERDRRRHGLDRIDVGPVEPLQELPGVGRERLRVPALPLGVERVEGERRLAGAGHARDDGQPPERDVDRDVLQVVGPRAADADGRRASGSRDSSSNRRIYQERAAGRPLRGGLPRPGRAAAVRRTSSSAPSPR